MLAIIAKPYNPDIEETLSAPPAPFGGGAAGEGGEFGPTLDYDVLGGTVTLYFAESTYISEPDDTVPHETAALDMTTSTPPAPFGGGEAGEGGEFGPALEYDVHFDAALFAVAEAVESVYFEPRLKQSLNFAVQLWDGDEPAGRRRPGFGAIEIANGDGWLDDYLELGWDGRQLRVYEGEADQAFADWQLRAVLQAEAIEWTQGLVTLRVKDPQARADHPVTHTLYLGTGGAEGGTDIKGRPKPLAFGRCYNVPAVPVDTTNLVYQVHVRRTKAVDAVRDKGVTLTPSGSDRADYAALVAATIAAGEYDTCLAEGLFRLGASPEGRVTADVRGDDGAAGADYVDTTAGIVRRIATQFLDDLAFNDPDEIASSAFSGLEALQPAEIGYFTAEPVTAAAIFDALMMAIGGVWGVTLLGQLTVARLDLPTSTAAATLAQRDLGAGLARTGPVPSWRRRIGWKPVWATQSSDELAASVTDAARALYSEPLRFAVAETAAAAVTHKRAREVTVPGFFTTEADAAAEASRQQEMFGAVRSIYRARVQAAPFAHDLGVVIAIENLGRFGFAASEKTLLAGLTVDRARGETSYALWR